MTDLWKALSCAPGFTWLAKRRGSTRTWQALWIVLIAGFAPGGSGGCSCEGDARITKEDQVAADETMVNCQCAVNFDGLAQDFGGAPASLVLDMPTCLPENLNVHIAPPARQAELRALSATEYAALIGDFCNSEVKNTVTAAIGFLKGSACGHFTVANCAPVDPSGMGGSASARNAQCEMPCQSIACDATTCDPKLVAPTVSAIDVSKCACTDLNGCGASEKLCTPPPAFDPAVGSTSQALTSGVMTRLATPTLHSVIDSGFSDASISVEVCKTIILVDVCTSDSANAAVGGYVNLVGKPCPGASCNMTLETWLKAEDIDLEFDITVVEVGSAHIHDLSLTAATDPNAVHVNADGTGVIPAGALHITATGNESGKRFTFHDTNETDVHITIDYATGKFTVPGFTFNFDGGHATLDLEGSFTPLLTASAGSDQALECNVFGGASTTLSGSSNAAKAAYTWYEGEAFGVPVEPADFSGPLVPVVAPLGSTQYQLLVSGAGLQVATDSMLVSVSDTQPPTIVPQDVTVECSAPNGQAVAVPPPTVSDVCDPLFIVTNDAPATFQLGNTTINYSATDASGNVAHAQSVVHVVDTTPPVITAPAMNIARCEPAPKTELLTVSVGDTCTGNAAQIALQGALISVNGHALPSPLAVNAADPRVLLPIGVSTIRWIASDAHGNSSAPVLQIVTVTETDTAAVCCVAPYTNVVEGNDLPSIVLLPLTRSYCVFGRGGIDAITTGLGADLISGGTGNDTLQSGTTNDVLLGRDGNDNLLLPIGDGRVYGGNGADLITNAAGGTIFGNAGDDRIIGIFGTHIITPGPGRDFVDAGPGNDTVIINDLCEVQALESLSGGFGTDTLITPVPVATLQSMGVIVLSFENIVVDTSRHHLAECF